MQHNEIAAVYRGVAEALGFNFSSMSPTEHAFWDKKIYNFAKEYEQHSIRLCKFALLHEVWRILNELEELNVN